MSFNPIVLYRNKYANPPLPPPDTLLNKTILITGANTGLGLALALHCLNLGASHLILTVRSTAKGDGTKAYLESHTTSKSYGITVMYLDMLTFQGVVDFAEQVKREIKVIDVVYLNAGVLNMKGAKVVSPEGWEVAMQINVLSTALLAILLLPWLKVAGKGEAHLAFTGSGLHRSIAITPESGWPQKDIFTFWKDPINIKNAGGPGTNARSKLLLEYVVREVANLATDRNGRPEIIVNSTCPAGVKTELGRDMMSNPITAILGSIFLAVGMKSAEEGAKTLVYAALTKPEENGKFFTFYQSDEEYLKITQHNIHGLQGQKMQKIVWNELIALLGKEVPEVLEIVGLRRET